MIDRSWRRRWALWAAGLAVVFVFVFAGVSTNGTTQVVQGVIEGPASSGLRLRIAAIPSWMRRDCEQDLPFPGWNLLRTDPEGRFRWEHDIARPPRRDRPLRTPNRDHGHDSRVVICAEAAGEWRHLVTVGVGRFSDRRVYVRCHASSPAQTGCSSSFGRSFDRPLRKHGVALLFVLLLLDGLRGRDVLPGTTLAALFGAPIVAWASWVLDGFLVMSHVLALLATAWLIYVLWLRFRAVRSRK